MSQTDYQSMGKFSFHISIIWVLAFFGATFFVYFDFGIRMIYGYGFLLACTMWCALKNEYIILTREKGIFGFLALMISLFIFLGNSNEGTVEYAIGVDLCALLVIVYIPKKEDYIDAMKLMLFFSILFSMYSISVFVFPNLYHTFIEPRISTESVKYNADLLRDGYGVALGANVAYIDYIAAIGVIFSASCIINQYKLFKSRLLVFLSLIISAIGMLCVNRKGEILGVAVAMLIIYRAYVKCAGTMKKRRVNKLVAKLLLIAVIAIVILSAKGYLLRFYLFFNKIVRNLSNDKVDMTSGRLFIWKYAFNMFKRRPLLGIGWEQFKMKVPALEIDTVKVHNNFLQLMLETGIIGFVLIITPMVMLMVVTYNKMKSYFMRDKSTKLVSVAYMLSFGMQVFFFVLNFLDPSIYKMHFWPIYTISIASLIFARNYDLHGYTVQNFEKTGKGDNVVAK